MEPTSAACSGSTTTGIAPVGGGGAMGNAATCVVHKLFYNGVGLVTARGTNPAGKTPKPFHLLVWRGAGQPEQAEMLGEPQEAWAEVEAGSQHTLGDPRCEAVPH